VRIISMFPRPEWPDTSSRKFRWTLLIGFVLLVISVEVAVNALVVIPDTTKPAWLCQHAVETANPVQAENNCPGTTSWREDHLVGPGYEVEGFTSPISAQAGEIVKLYVSTIAPTYSFEVYRMGWYNGRGGRLVYSSPVLPGINQPPPLIDPTTRMVSCINWRSPASLQIPMNWVSGFYVVKLLAGRYMRYTFFVLRNDSSHSAILFQSSVLTYEAYNAWGGYSLYGSSGHQKDYYQRRAYAVSFDRPNDRGDGLGDFPLFNEYNLLRWLERSGYDISYTTDIDTDQRGSTLLQHRLFIIAGHDEYWSTAMRDHVTAARDAGVSLAFFGANDMYWHVRLQSSPLGADHIVVCYKVDPQHGDKTVDPLTASDPSQTTTFWHSPPLNQPENAVIGEMHAGIVVGSAPLVISSGAQPFYANTSLHEGSTINGLVGGEYDRVFQNSVSPPNLVILAHSPLLSQTRRDTSDATLYIAPSGARVFDAGTFYWAWGLDDDSFVPSAHIPPHPYANAAFQRFTANLLAYLMR
jgi:hypothetical protein